MHQLAGRCFSLTAFVAAIVALTIAAHGAEYNFYEQADKQGCASIITEHGQEECAKVQATKNEMCSVPVRCDFNEFERRVDKYKEAKDRLDRGQVADADKAKLEESVRDAKNVLDALKQNARTDTAAARGCVDARRNVQKWFSEVGIPLTERTRDEATQLRKGALEKLADAQRKQGDAKSKRDAKPGDSGAQTDYERATDELRTAENELARLNAKYGRDIERYADKLLRHYKDEKDSHDRPLIEASNRLDACKKIDNTNY